MSLERLVINSRNIHRNVESINPGITALTRSINVNQDPAS
jgi:hypothetical protein